MGDGNNDVVGPFEASQSRFFRGQIIPLCAGWFGEINEDFDKIIYTLAREASSGENGMTVSPLINADIEKEGHSLLCCSSSGEPLVYLSFGDKPN